jgi:nucleotide-binding universal stress UspA family protein
MEDENIVGLAEKVGTDLIVIGSRRLSRMKRLLLIPDTAVAREDL